MNTQQNPRRSSSTKSRRATVKCFQELDDDDRLLVLDKGLFALESSLVEAGVHVIKVDPKASSEETAGLLQHRVLVTRRPKAFLERAPIEEYGVVSLKKFGPDDGSGVWKAKAVTAVIEALTKYNLWWSVSYVLELHASGDHQLEELC
ncbi:MAG: hypothetical protein ACK4RK_09515 [Gemmataceae bacterium]